MKMGCMDEATMILADAAHKDPEGLVHALGMGWTRVNLPTPPMVLITFLRVPFGDHQFRVVLQDDMGEPVTTSTGEPVQGEYETTLVRAAGSNQQAIHSDFTHLFRVGAGLPLEPGRIYQFVLTVDDRFLTARTLHANTKET